MKSIYLILQVISKNRLDFRLCLFIFSQIVILTKSEYTSELVGLSFIFSIIVCLSHIFCERWNNDRQLPYREVIRKSRYSIYFSGVMLFIWLIVLNKWQKQRPCRLWHSLCLFIRKGEEFASKDVAVATQQDAHLSVIGLTNQNPVALGTHTEFAQHLVSADQIEQFSVGRTEVQN